MSVDGADDASRLSAVLKSIPTRAKLEKGAGTWLFWGAFSILICAVIFLGMKEPKRNEKQLVQSRDTSLASIGESVVVPEGPLDSASGESMPSMRGPASHGVVDMNPGMALRVGGGMKEQSLVSQDRGSHADSAPSGAEDAPSSAFSTDPRGENRARVKSFVEVAPFAASAVNRSVEISGKPPTGYHAPWSFFERRRYRQPVFYPYYHGGPWSGYSARDPYVYYPPRAR
uniref:Transmembrane protein n=1 Tax=Candidatus Kentrum sp. SD TaxID=2126332 RepID=A0A451BI94_9GAMM|nr:MAG: hypothetical protein BECKSD772F_GA0070984_100618 [Candidatus Kentron sp. SD]VFK40632.1 MAG: hypothetical protein BECKSD772E_GA0070983_10089 [Candidatus Kentron sp. SD]VFK78020.1 MAG: hypothetical protein BECKSD772D_GA0070982_100523 [Candidatus Kentron sp. SD]